MSLPAAREPSPKPPIKAERTIETTGVVTPYWAIARRSQTSSYNIPQNPEIRKKMKYQIMKCLSLIAEGVARSSRAGLSIFLAMRRLSLSTCQLRAPAKNKIGDSAGDTQAYSKDRPSTRASGSSVAGMELSQSDAIEGAGHT